MSNPNSIAHEILPVHLEEELKKSYLDYAMSVIVGRALPDVRDGLKPVHRRVLFAMKELGNDFNKPYKKSARIVGDVIGKYHPHGDIAVYDTIVRMAQPFSLRYMLVDGQGNFGSVDGDSPAAMRYTEIRMSKIAHVLLKDIDKGTVNYSLNYDETEEIPDVLPTRIPNLIVNGSSGIAVGMATNIPPHNLGEVIDATVALIENPELTITDLMHYLPGPDFPTAANIFGRAGIVDAYHTGRGRVMMRAKADIEEMDQNRSRIIVTEIPYQVNKARLIEKIAELVKEKKIEGISELRDESDKDGMRICIELRRGEVAEVILNNLYVQTQLQMSFGVNMVALVNNQPKLLNLKEVLIAFIEHRKEVVTRRTIFELAKARKRAHLLEGLAVALANIDDVIKLIKSARTPQIAKTTLLEADFKPGIVVGLLNGLDRFSYAPADMSDKYGLLSDQLYRLSPDQVDAILELRLHRLTGLEQDKIIDEFKLLIVDIERYCLILNDINLLLEIISQELIEIKDDFADDRRTQIVEAEGDFDYEDLITEEQRVVTLSDDGYVKSQPLSEYQAQKRGGKGKVSTKMKEEDSISKFAVASSHDTMLCFSTLGKVYWSKVYKFPLASRQSKGKPINNVLMLAQDEKITTILPVSEYDPERFVFMVTTQAVVKKVSLEAFSRPRKMGINAINLDEGDALLGALITSGEQQMMLFSNGGKAIRFNESDVRATGRAARGIRGMRLQGGQSVVAIISTHNEEDKVLAVTENGYGKRTYVNQYRMTARGSQGVIAISCSERNGTLMDAVLVNDDDDIMLMTDQGMLVRTPVDKVAQTSRNTQGVRLIRLNEGEKLIKVRAIESEEEEGDEEGTQIIDKSTDTGAETNIDMDE